MSKEKYQIVPFAGDNYNAWEFRLKSILRDNGVIEAIEKEDFNVDALDTKKSSVGALSRHRTRLVTGDFTAVDVATGNTTEAETTVRQLITRPKGEVEESHFLQALKILKVTNLIFGSSAYAHIPQKLRMKLDPRGVKLKMVGYAPGGYRLWDANERRIYIERNVLFREETCSESPETISIDVESVSDKKEKDSSSSPEKTKTPLTSDNYLESFKPEGRDTDDVNSRVKRKKTKPKYLQEFVTDDSDLDGILMASFLSCSNGNVTEKYDDIDSYDDKNR
ncbi:unnamed protein product [Arctia plantaginis]|uniref:Retroviral polymerase SH3-like domain-containing protein n=1 Tax=Arctia plantaginis TaxID=874455 RepID=A0A8S1ANB6_ARCPL|nr:unnamed protein product [Arctia plantaginis]